MKNFIATWICIDDSSNGTHFPSAKGNSAQQSVQDIYWRCICTFFWSARQHNPTAELVLFSNQQHLPHIEKTAVSELLDKLDVHFYMAPFEYITPAGYYREWRNQFYEFSIFKFITNHPDFDEADQLLLLDSDCIITADLSGLFDCLHQEKCITYLIDYGIDHTINGNSRKDMKHIFEELLAVKLDEYPPYHGGEFYASTVTMMKVLMEDFYTVWPQLLALHAAGLPKLHEEAHVLSYLFFKNGIDGGQANKFIKRLWTDPSTYRNVALADASLPIWHLPAEKRKGFKRLFTWLQSNVFDIIDSKAIVRQRIERMFLVPHIPIKHKPYYAAKYLVKKMLS